MSDFTAISFSVVGYGRIGKRHARMIAENQGAALIACIDNQRSALEAAGEQHKNIGLYKTVETFIKKDAGKTDVICLCVPNGLHAPLAVKCLEYGYHVVIEKPMALSKIECEDIIHTSMKASKQVFVVKQNRYSPPSKWLKKIVDDRILGEIYTVQINCFWNRDDRYYTKDSWHGDIALDGGTLFTQFSHFVDIMYWVFGDITDSQGRFSNHNHRGMIDFEDSGIIHFNFKRGAQGVLSYSTSCWDTNMESSLTVIGEHGSVKIGGQYMNEIEYCHIRDYEQPVLEPTRPPNRYGPYTGSAANHHFVIQNVIDTLRGEDSITANALEGMKVVEIIEKMYKDRDLKALQPAM